MSSVQSFPLRIPAELKQAAKALSEVGLVWRSAPRREGGIASKSVDSINTVILYLMRTGIRPTIDLLEKDIADARENHEAWQSLVQFFINNPPALHVLPDNFPEGSKARWFISTSMEFDKKMKKVSKGLERAFAASQFAHWQGRLLKLTAAKGALQRALCPAAGDNKS